ncbi:hypothetical protein OROGR_022197 [Orobanche gracilis]
MPVRNIINQIPSSPVMKQGIVTILGSDCEMNRSAAVSIRRTLSADMSSKKWLEQYGFFPQLKNTVSSCSSSSSEVEEEFDRTPGQDDVWKSIQGKEETQRTTKMEYWGSILKQKSENSLIPPPYVHPLVKSSLSGLSEKSLEICTESLGSETGSESFSSGCSTERLSEQDEVCTEKREALREYQSAPFADLDVVKYRTSPGRPLPPTIPSIAGGGDGAPQLHMQSRRVNGRLILEAITVSPKNYFHAQRGDGRLVLTLVRGEKTTEENEKIEEVFGNMDGVADGFPTEEMVDDGGGDGGFDEEDEDKFVVEKDPSFSHETIDVHKKSLVTKKFMAAGNMNATWSNKEKGISIRQSLPPPSRVTRLIPAAPAAPAAASFNVYDYFWRNKAIVSGGSINLVITYPESIENKISKNISNDNNNDNRVDGNRDLVIMKGNKGEHLVPCLRGCKEPRRLLINWEPYCITTS